MIIDRNVRHITDVVGHWGKWQKNIFFFYLTTSIFSAFHNLGLSLIAPKVEFWCATDKFKNSTEKCFEDAQRTIPCTKWIYDQSFLTHTVISEWDLVCDRAWLVSITQSLYMCGMTLSAIFCGHFSDKYGRLPVLWAAVLMELIAGLSCAFSVSIIQFMISRFILAIGAYGRYLTGFMLVIETSGPQHRASMGVICRLGWAVGCLLLPAIVFVFTHFRHVLLAFILPEILWLFWLWKIPESPRWQLAKGDTEKAREELRKAAKLNDRRMTGLEDQLDELKGYFEKECQEESVNKKANFFDLFKTPNLRKNTIILSYTWLVTGFIYYGLTLNIGDLGGNLLINFAIAGALEFPSFALSLYALKKLGRRPLQFMIMFSAGIGSLIVIPFYFINLPHITVINITLAMIVKFCISVSYYTIYIYSAEVYPTLVRQVGVGFNSGSSRLGSIMAPFVKELSQYTHISVSFATFAFTSMTSAFSILLLPETKGKEIPDTLVEAEQIS